MIKKLTYITAEFVEMSAPEEMVGYLGNKKNRAIVTLETEDGQKAFFEVRDSVIQRITRLGFSKGDTVTAGFVMIGSEKGGKKYNNFFINQIDYAEQPGPVRS
jgi:DNA helicase TIP49 (TBP-interacting protein)